MPIAIQTALPRVLTDALRGAMPEAMPEALPKAMREAMLKAVLKVMPTAMLDVEELADALLDELCTNDPDKPSLTSTETGFKVNDYLEYQTPKSDILARQERGRKMARARWKKKTNAVSNAQSNALGNAKSNTEIEIEKEIDNYPLTPNGVSPQGGKRATQKKPRKTSRPKPLPPDWKPNPTHARIALEAGVDLETEAEKFRDYLKASGKTYIDHDAAFRNWLRSPYRNNAGHAAPRYRTQADQLERMFQVAAASDLADQAATDSAEIFTLPAPTGGDAA